MNNPLNFSLLSSTSRRLQRNRHLLFLAAPYSHPDYVTRGDRAAYASDMAARLMGAGYAVFSPISHGDAIWHADPDDVPIGASAWCAVNNSILHISDALVLLDIPGLWESAGVRHEVNVASFYGVPINLVRLNDLTLQIEVQAGLDPRSLEWGAA